jgi:hypothetical protein
VWVTKNGGKDWIDVTTNIKDHPGYWVSRVEPSHFNSGTAYVTITGLRNDDFRPFIWKTTDYGQTWRNIANNLPDEPIWVIREHFRNPDLLFIGTTKQVHVSIDGGKNWNPMRSNMPFVACEDLKIHPRENDLIVGTHGRSIYIADISWLEQLTPDVIDSDVFLFRPETRVQLKRKIENHSSSSNYNGESESPGVVVNYFLKDTLDDATIRIHEGARLIYEAKADKKPGMNRYVWNYQERVRERTAEEKEELRKQMERFRGGGAGRAGGGRFGGRGARGQNPDSNFIMTQAGPGEYTVTLFYGGKELKEQVVVLQDSWH